MGPTQGVPHLFCRCLDIALQRTKIDFGDGAVLPSQAKYRRHRIRDDAEVHKIVRDLIQVLAGVLLDQPADVVVKGTHPVAGHCAIRQEELSIEWHRLWVV